MRPDDPNWHSQVEPPLVLDDGGEPPWDEAADVLVVGLGIAGACAALQAKEGGLDVIALDRELGGGATVLSGGVVYAGGGTSVQKQVGEQDSPDAMFEYLKLETQGVVSDETLMRFCRESASTLDWLMAHGVQFSGPVWKEKTSYPNVDYFLYHSDNSLLPAYRGDQPPAARGHRGVIRSGKSATNLGGSIFFPLRDAAERLGVHVHRKAEVRQLVMDADGCVIGVKALQFAAGSAAFSEHERCVQWGERLARAYPRMLPGGKWVARRVHKFFQRAAELEASAREVRYYRARRGVVLSAGGFIFNRAMVRHYCPQYRRGMPLGTRADDGSGIRLGQSAGGDTTRMSRGTAWRFINPPRAWSQGIIVNARGERYVNECTYGATIGDAMVERNDGMGWLILDGELIKQAWRQILPGRVLPFQRNLAALNMLFGRRKAKDEAALCAEFGFDPNVLNQTLADYARAARGDIADAFAKPPTDIHALRPPYHVIDVSLSARLLPCTVLTMGGLVVDERSGQVLDEAGRPIAGLYAAGRSAVGIPSHLYMSGLSLADGVFAGRRAAHHLSGAPGIP